MLRNHQKNGNNINGIGIDKGTGVNIGGTSTELIDVIKEQQKQISTLISENREQLNAFIDLIKNMNTKQ